MNLNQRQRNLIKSSPVRHIVGAYEQGNETVLDYALSVATPSQHAQAVHRAIGMGVDVSYGFDTGMSLGDNR